jgi:3-oxoacyl-[acyl-carrier-protein] synthase-1
MTQPAARALAVVSVGMACNVGLNAAAACAAVRGHVNRFDETFFRDSDGGPVMAGVATEVVEGRQGYRRLSPLLRTALADCLGGAESTPDALRTVPCLIVVGSGNRPDYPPNLPQTLLSELSAAFGVGLHPQTRVVAAGAAGVFKALAAARVLLDVSGSCIVAAVDSLVNRKILRALSADRRLKTETDSDGVVPGEAAAAVWLTRPSETRPALAHILGIGVADEPSVLNRDQPNKGIGLAHAMSAALSESGLELHEIDFRVAGMTGERLAFVEASTALARIQKVHKDNFELWVPAEQLGDVGAALSACIVVVATMGIAKGYSAGPRGIVYCAPHGEARVACVLAAEGG